MMDEKQSGETAFSTQISFLGIKGGCGRESYTMCSFLRIDYNLKVMVLIRKLGDWPHYFWHRSCAKCQEKANCDLEQNRGQESV
jgi:hypothetical protein